MSFCFVILNWNKYDLTTNAVESTEKVEEGNYGIIVVDNNSQIDEREKLIRYFRGKGWTILNEDKVHQLNKSWNLNHNEHSRILLLANKNYGYAKGNNLGLMLAYKLGYEWAVIMNNDVTLEIPVVRDLIKTAQEDPLIAVIGPRVIDKYGKTQWPMDKPTIYHSFLYPLFYPIFYPFEKVRLRLKYKRFKKSSSRPKIFYPYAVAGCFMVTNLHALNAVGWFDENTFLYAEELILSEKLFKKGFKVAYTETVYVKHIHEATTLKLGSTRRKINLESHIYYFKHYRHYGPLKILMVKTGHMYLTTVVEPILIRLKEVLFRAKRNHSSRRLGNKAVSDDTGNE